MYVSLRAKYDWLRMSWSHTATISEIYAACNTSASQFHSLLHIDFIKGDHVPGRCTLRYERFSKMESDSKLQRSSISAEKVQDGMMIRSAKMGSVKRYKTAVSKYVHASFAVAVTWKGDADTKHSVRFKSCKTLVSVKW